MWCGPLYFIPFTISKLRPNLEFQVSRLLNDLRDGDGDGDGEQWPELKKM